LTGLGHIQHITELEATTVPINIAEAKAKLSALLDRALAGEEIVIARAGKPMARLVPIETMTRRKPGAWRGFKISNEALFAPMDPEDVDAAEGKHTDEFGITLRRSSEP
jgi:prevent-host-death family protein